MVSAVYTDVLCGRICRFYQILCFVLSDMQEWFRIWTG